MTALALPRALLGAERRIVLQWWLFSRLVTLAAFGVLTALGPRGSFGPRLYGSPFGLLGSWDGTWYRRIAEHGYLLVPGHASDPAFFPLFPILLRFGHELTGLPLNVVGVAIANVALAFGLVAFYEVGRHVVSERVAMDATIYAAFAPLAFVYSMVYPTSLLFAFAALAPLAGFRGRWLTAAALAAAAALTRPEAIVLAVPLASIAWSQRASLDSSARGRALAAVLAAPAALATYPLYLKWSLNDARAWTESERYWGRSFSLLGPVHAFTNLGTAVGQHHGFIRDVALIIVYLVLLVAAARHGVPRAWIVAGAALVVLPLFSGTFESEGRFGLLAFASYWGLAAIARSRRSRIVALSISAAALVAGVVYLPYVWP